MNTYFMAALAVVAGATIAATHQWWVLGVCVAAYLLLGLHAVISDRRPLKPEAPQPQPEPQPTLEDEIHAAQADSVRVEVLVTNCTHMCCGRISTRNGYEQTYEGFIRRTDEAGFMIEKPGVGKYTYRVNALFDDVLAVTPV